MRLAIVIILGTLMVPERAHADSVETASHVRPTTGEIRRIIEAGMSTSSTFRRLASELNASDVIVYVDPKLTRAALGGYLSHTVVASGEYRYLRVAIETAGPPRSLVPILAHELQHAVEVSRARDVRDADALERLFASLAIPYGCAQSSCFETHVATDVERLVKSEMTSVGRDQRLLKERRPVSSSPAAHGARSLR